MNIYLVPAMFYVLYMLSSRNIMTKNASACLPIVPRLVNTPFYQLDLSFCPSNLDHMSGETHPLHSFEASESKQA